MEIEYTLIEKKDFLDFMKNWKLEEKILSIEYLYDELDNYYGVKVKLTNSEESNN